MKHTIALVCFALLCGHVAAQEGQTFNVVMQNQVQGPATGFSVKEVPDGYLVFSGQRGLSSTPQDPFVTLFDFSGQVVWEKDYVVARYSNYGLPDPVCRTPDGGFASGVSVFGLTSDIDSLFLWRFDAQGDTVFTRFLMADTTMTIRKCIRTMNGDFVLTGLHEFPEEQYLLRTDSLGNIKHFAGFANFDGYGGMGLAEDPSGNFYLTGFQDNIAHRGSLIKCDSVGNLLWTRLYEMENGISEWLSALVLSDSSVLVVGDKGVNFGNSSAIISRYTSDGDLLWTDDVVTGIGGPSYINRLTDAFQRPDGTIVVAGQYEWQGTGFFGFVQAYSMEGDSLWRRAFRYMTDSVYSYPAIWDLEPTSDGGMILTGAATIMPGYSEHLWLVKTDSLGCVVPGCQNVGVQEFTIDLQEHLDVSPNPAHDRVNVLLTLPETGEIEGQAQVLLLDATGRTVLEQPMQRNLNQLRTTVEVSALPAGMFYLHLCDAQRWLAGSKVVVE
ncbi:MAG: T9SS type A sorting domain-containing protein [Flavobacteriales bacterium]|nr:T9SS type A sorting domain-containing protein [Flavobacteriales bacterium]